MLVKKKLLRPSQTLVSAARPSSAAATTSLAFDGHAMTKLEKNLWRFNHRHLLLRKYCFCVTEKIKLFAEKIKIFAK